MKNLRHAFSCGALLAAFGLANIHAANSVLTFSPPVGDGVAIATNFGSNLANTPNITVSYRSIDPSSGSPGTVNFLKGWTTGYGDLTNVAYAAVAGYTAEITFTAAAGFQVNLASFDIAAFGGPTQFNQTIRLLDGSFNVLNSFGSPLTVTGGNVHQTFSPNATGSILRIQFGPSVNLGIDNISFGQSVVTPNQSNAPDAGSSLWLLAGALLGVAALRRKIALA